MNILSLILLLFNLGPLQDLGFRGDGIKIAVIDGGFYRVNEEKEVFPEEHILGYYDLTEQELDIFSDPTDKHGSMVLSTMLSDQPELKGTAPDAGYYLIRTEIGAVEQPIEIDNLIKGLALADSLGADIITISLGYTKWDEDFSLYNFTYDSINGKSRASKAITELARKGKIVCIAAGNDGQKPWHYIGVPADADSILTVGACSADSIAAPFSSYGPTYDGRLKPEVSALGWQTTVYDPETSNYILGNGTSFATPEIAGMVACLWQALPELSAMQLRRLILESCSLYGTANTQMGYGIPDAWRVYSRATALRQTKAVHTEKIIDKGQIIIIRNGEKYSTLGIRVE